jgi:hypothetical protein
MKRIVLALFVYFPAAMFWLEFAAWKAARQ